MRVDNNPAVDVISVKCCRSIVHS